MRKYIAAGWIMLIFGVALILTGRILAFIKVETQLILQGPDIQFSSERKYWIDDHIIPPIDRDTPIELNVTALETGGPIYVFLYPLSYMIPAPGQMGGMPIASGVLNGSSREFLFSGHAPISDQYVIELIVYNNTYSARLRSVFPPLYGLRGAAIPAILLIPGGLAVIYYDGIRMRREKMFKKAIGSGDKARRA